VGQTIIHSPNQYPPPGTPAGDAARARFISRVLAITGETPLFWLPSLSDTTTSTGVSRNTGTVTHAVSLAARKSVLGSGLAISFDAAADYATIPDADIFSFGDGTKDTAFSVLALVNLTADASQKTIISKRKNQATVAREWSFHFDSTEKLVLLCYDDSATAYIEADDNAVLTAATWTLVAGTYDGARSFPGLDLGVNAAARTLVNNGSGTYVAMENLTYQVSIGVQFDSGGAAGSLFNGSMAFVLVCAKALTLDEQWAIKAAVNEFYGLSL
jgi:hypothetical protein